jgi:hypothetical protein
VNKLYLKSWDKLILVLIFLGVVFYLNSLFGKGSGTSVSNGTAQNPATSVTTTPNTQFQAQPLTPTPTIVNSIQRIRGGTEGEGFDN